MKIGFYLICFASCIFLFPNMSEESETLEKIRKELEKNSTKDMICMYLNHFPKNLEKFKYIFYGKKNAFDELYDTHEYHLRLLWSFSNDYPTKVLKIWLQIAKDAHGEADALTILQSNLTKFASIKTKLFSDSLKKYDAKSQDGIISFMADVEAHDINFDYQKIMNNLKKLKLMVLYEQFRIARIDRMKNRHD